MSTDLHGVRVLDIDAKVITFEVFLTYVSFYRGDVPCLQRELPEEDAVDFFLMLLLDRVPGAPKPKLKDIIREEHQQSEDWLCENGDQYIEAIEVVSRREDDVTPESLGFPPSASEYYVKFYRLRDGGWQDEARLPRAVYRVTVGDPTWTAHLRPGATWGTTAYTLFD
ncbi:MAG: hypothetical protein AAGE52_11225 [Myxococcota bacterium]